jgi:hypothetical protein
MNAAAAVALHSGCAIFLGVIGEAALNDAEIYRR